MILSNYWQFESRKTNVVFFFLYQTQLPS